MIKRLQKATKEEKVQWATRPEGMFFRKYLANQGLHIVDLWNTDELAEEFKNYRNKVGITDTNDLTDKELDTVFNKAYQIAFN